MPREGSNHTQVMSWRQATTKASRLNLAPAEMGKGHGVFFPSLFTQVSTEPMSAHAGDRVGALSLSLGFMEPTVLW